MLQCMVLDKRGNKWLTSNTLRNRATPVSIALTLSQTGTLQMMGGVAEIDSNWSRNDITVAHNTTCDLSTVLQQSNTSPICSCVHNAKVCKFTTCQNSKSSCCMPAFVCLYVQSLYSLNLYHLITPNHYVKCVLYCNSCHRCLDVLMKCINLQDTLLIQHPSNV